MSFLRSTCCIANQAASTEVKRPSPTSRTFQMRVLWKMIEKRKSR